MHQGVEGTRAPASCFAFVGDDGHRTHIEVSYGRDLSVYVRLLSDKTEVVFCPVSDVTKKQFSAESIDEHIEEKRESGEGLASSSFVLGRSQ